MIAKPDEPMSLKWARQAKQWTELEAAASLLEESRSAFLSQMMQRLIKSGEARSVAAAEMQVKASTEWSDYTGKMVKAREAANMARVRKEYYHMLFMEKQSEAATERVQARL